MKTGRFFQVCCILCVFLFQTGFAQWTPVNGPTEDVMYLAANGTNIFAQTNTGFFFSTDNGSHWRQANPGLADSLVSTFPADSANFLIGNMFGQLPPLPNGLDLQTARIEVSALLSLVTSLSILSPPTDIDSVLVSLDTGSTALKISQIMTSLALYAAGLDTADILSKIELARMLISMDGGKVWIPIQEIMSNISVRALEKTDDYVFVGTNKGVFRAAINGPDLSPVNIGLTNTNVHALATINTTLFAATDGGVFLTRNNGITWNPVNSGLTATRVLALVAAGNSLFAGTQGGGVFLLNEYGTNWRAVNQGLTSVNVNALAIGDNTLFAGTQAGVFAATLNWLLPPLPPQGLVVTDSSIKTIKIKWRKNTEADFLRYRIYRGTSPNPTTKVDSTTAGLADTSKTFAGLTNGTRYYLRVTAMDNSGNESGYSNEVNAAPADRMAPVAPQNLAVTDSSSGTITIKWHKNTEADFLRYRIYRGTSVHPSTKVDSTTAGAIDTSKKFTGLTNGTRYYFRVSAVDSAGNESAYSNEVSGVPTVSVGVDGIPSLVPKEYSLSQNYPNPFNPSTIIEYDLAAPGQVSVQLYDGLGRLVKNLIDEVKEAGHYQFRLNAADLPSGAYYYRLVAGSFTQTRKMMLLR